MWKEEKTIKNQFGQTLMIRLCQKFHLRFVVSTNPPQLLARVPKSWDLQRHWQESTVHQQNRLQSEFKASGKMQEDY